MKINIRSVLFNIGTILPEQDFNEDLFLEWGFSALRLINSKNSVEQKVIELPIQEHIVALPPYKVINQVQIKQKILVSDYDKQGNSISYIKYGDFSNAIKTNESFFSPDPCINTNNCVYKYKESNNKLIVNVKDGTAKIDYMAYTEEIEDNEYIKKAIEDFILYRLAQRKSLINEKYIQIAQSYYNQFIISSAQARGEDNLPSLDELEHIRKNYTNLIPRDRWEENFTTNPVKLRHL